MTFLNLTRSKTQIYTIRTPQIKINSHHQFINIKFNAVLFNQRNNPSFVLLVIDDQGRRLYNNLVQANDVQLNCVVQTSVRPASSSFYSVIRLSTSTPNILFQITSTQIGDEIGISDLQVFSGNCFLGCATCDGPGANQCISCSNLLTYNDVQKTCTGCPPRFYKANSICLPCPYNC